MVTLVMANSLYRSAGSGIRAGKGVVLYELVMVRHL